jgi:ribose 1,5-bisphosphokinase PhnN
MRRLLQAHGRVSAKTLTPREKYEIDVTLHDGRVVGSWSRDWMIECEARHLLAMPLHKRRDQLDARVKQRGAKSVEELKAVMASIHTKRKT